MQAQTNMLTAHAQVVAMQNVPKLPRFAGEDHQGDEDNFEKWNCLKKGEDLLSGQRSSICVN